MADLGLLGAGPLASGFDLGIIRTAMIYNVSIVESSLVDPADLADYDDERRVLRLAPGLTRRETDHVLTNLTRFLDGAPAPGMSLRPRALRVVPTPRGPTALSARS